MAVTDDLLQSAAAMLQRGDPRGALRLLQPVADGGAQHPALFTLIAQSHSEIGDRAAEEAWIDRLLEIAPRHLMGLIRKGDRRWDARDPRSAVSFYQMAAKVGAATPGLPLHMARELQRIALRIEEAGSNFQGHLEDRILSAGADPAAIGPRFAESLDILFQRKQPYFQQPSAFFYPRLPHIQFYERETFDWAERVEAETDAIRAELAELLKSEAGFKPYVQQEENRPKMDFHDLLDDPSWSAFYLVEHGTLNETHAARCPRTMAAMEGLPLTQMRGRTPSVFFSMLRAGARIPPHTGMLNTRLVCHLPLVVPEGCGIRVGNETRAWEEGKLLIFDDSIEHEAWNDSAHNRVVLIFDIWRPELDEAERRGIATIFEAIDGV